MRRPQLLLIPILLIVSLAAVALPGAVFAATASSNNISQSYNADAALRTGMIVALQAGKTDLVEPAKNTSLDRVVGVVVQESGSLVAVDPDVTKAQVARSGNSAVLVSTVNGDIKSGDMVTVSPFSGIGMRAVASHYRVGRALGSFTSSSAGVEQQQVQDKNGKPQTIVVGYVQIALNPGFNSDAEGANITGLQGFVRSLTGHVVSTPRIIMSMVVAIVSISVVGVLIYAAIYGSIISIGRNPLARVSILTALRNVVILVVFIVLMSFAVVYLLLR